MEITHNNLPAAIQFLISEVNSLKLLLQASPHEPEDEFITVAQTVSLIKKAKPTIYKMIERGELPYYRQGRRVVFLKSEIVDYLKSGRRKSFKQLAEEGRA